MKTQEVYENALLSEASYLDLNAKADATQSVNQLTKMENFTQSQAMEFLGVNFDENKGYKVIATSSEYDIGNMSGFSGTQYHSD